MSTDNPQKAHVLGKAVAAARALRLPLLARGQVYLVAALYRPGSDEVVIHQPAISSIDTLPTTDEVITKETVRREAERHLALGEPVAVVLCGLATEPTPRGDVWGGIYNLPRKSRGQA